MTTSTTSPRLKRVTPQQEERAKRDLAIYKEYTSLVAIKGQSKTQVNQYLMAKYGIYSNATIYGIIKRVEEKQKGGSR